MNIDAISKQDNQLHLHEDKTLYGRYCSAKIHPICNTYKLDGKDVQVKQVCRDLGVYFSSDLSWSSHIDKVLVKAYRTFLLIKRSFPNTTNVTVKKPLYLALVLPIITYGSPIWCPYNLKDTTALEKFQRRATKFQMNGSTADYKTRHKPTNVTTDVPIRTL